RTRLALESKSLGCISRVPPAGVVSAGFVRAGQVSDPTRNLRRHATRHGHPVETCTKAILANTQIIRQLEGSRRSPHLRSSQSTRSSPFSPASPLGSEPTRCSRHG